MQIFNKFWQRAAIAPSISIEEAIRTLDEVGFQILIAVDDNGKLVGTITDGDIRRGLLDGLSLSSSVEPLVNQAPLVVPQHMQTPLVLQLMAFNKIHQLPIVDDAGVVLGIHLWDDLNDVKQRDNSFLIMCGGKGSRLRPFTESCPKPMLNLGDKPMLLHIIEKAKSEGFLKFILSINYLGEQIEDFFADGKDFGVTISYLREQEPLGTAGALRLLKDLPNEPILISNGDVISELRFGDILDFHTRHHASATMAVKSHEWQNPFGVVELKGLEIMDFKEKPIHKSYVNAGVYVLSPISFRHLPKQQTFDMPAIFEKLKLVNERTVAYPMHEPWLDVGKPNDLETAKNVVASKKTIL